MAEEENFNHDEFKKFIIDLAYPRNDMGKTLPQNPQQVILGGDSC